MELATMNSHKPLTHFGFCLLCCCTAKATSSCSSTCIYDRENRSLVPSSSVITAPEEANKVFGKHSTWLLDRFSKFIITTRLPLRWTSVDCRHLQCVIVQTEWHLHNSTVVKEEEASYIVFSLIMSYMLNLVICIGMILLDLLQCSIYIVVIDLSSTYDSTTILICNSLFMFMIYFLIKIKLKVLLFPT
jgi:hypothetical protein